MLPGMLRLRHVFSPISRALAIAPALLFAQCLADIRPDAMRSALRTANQEARGRQLLDQAAARYGSADRFLKSSGIGRAVFSDSWKAPLSRAVAMHWDQNNQRMELHWQLGTDNSRIRVLNGVARGKSFGLIGQRLYASPGPGQPVQPSDDADHRFALTTAIYFLEAPLRLPTAEIVRHIDTTQIGNAVYDRVFVSWGSEEPNMQYDQYVLYINQNSGLIERMHYTIREKFWFATGSCLYGDFRIVDGFRIPHRMTLVTHPTAEDDVYHEMVFTEIELGVSPPADYLNPPELTPTANRTEHSESTQARAQ